MEEQLARVPGKPQAALIVAGAWIGWAVFLVLAWSPLQSSIAIFITAPVVVTAWLYGVRGALIATAIGTPVHVLVLFGFGVGHVGDTVVVGHVGVALVGLTIGYMRDLSDKVARQTEATRAAEHLAASAEQARLQAETDMQLGRAESLAALGTLAAGVAHEINNPLTYLMFNVTVLQDLLRNDEAGLSPEASVRIARSLIQLDEGLERIKSTVQDLRVLAPGAEGALDSTETADVEEMIRDAVRVVDHQVSHRCLLRVENADVGNVTGDQRRLTQVLVNLLLNASQAIEPGDRDGNEIAITARRHDRVVVIEVSDTGCGIPESSVPLLFDPFFTTKPVGVGTGLGLYLARRLVDEIGGSIAVETELGRGSCFRIQLPQAAD